MRAEALAPRGARNQPSPFNWRRAAPRKCTLATVAGCALGAMLSFGVPTVRAQDAPVPATPRTTLYLHGRIYTNDPAHPWASGMAVRDGKIACIGEIATVMLECPTGDTPETIQLNGHFVMPGFNDAHVNLGGAAIDKLTVLLNAVPSVEELQKRLAVTVAQHRPGDWVTGSGWDQTLWPDKKFPTRQQLDAVSPNNPVFLYHVSGHVAVANSAALQLAGVSRTTPDPAGGKLERDDAGLPTGVLLEDSAMHLVRTKVPETTPEQIRQGMELVLAELARNGITSVQDNSDWETFSLYHKLKEEGNLTVRVTEWLPFDDALEDLKNMRAEGGVGDPMLRTGLLSAVLDGTLGAHTAALLAPYADDANASGNLTGNVDALRKMAIERDKLGFQLAFHAVGDKANRAALDIFEAVAKANGERDRRDRVERAEVLAPEDLPRFAALGVVASMQPSPEDTDMRWAQQRLGPERSKGAYAWASLLKSGAQLAFGTGYDAQPLNPMRALYACTTRALPEGVPQSSAPGDTQGGAQDVGEPLGKISLEDCIRAYTTGSAYAEFSQGKKGELKPGEFADFLILSADLMKIPPAQYMNTTVLRTVVGGRTVYEARK